MMIELGEPVKSKLIRCLECGEEFRIKAQLYAEKVDSNQNLYCPNGHRLAIKPVVITPPQQQIPQQVDSSEIVNKVFIDHIVSTHEKVGRLEQQN